MVSKIVLALCLMVVVAAAAPAVGGVGATYNLSQLLFEGISNVNVDKLTTDIVNDDQLTTDIINDLTEGELYYRVRQPRLNHKPFTVVDGRHRRSVDVKSDVTADVVAKFFLGPKYDNNGNPLSIDDNWMNFVELNL